MTEDSSVQPQYSKLAEIYDSIMEDVDYEVWADFIDETIQVHHPNPTSVLELACGTGSLSLSLDELMCYDIIATDKSEYMIEKARSKAEEIGANVDFKMMDFLNITLREKFDIAVSIFDSINYLHHSADLQNLFKEVERILKTDGLFIFDFATPENSIQAVKYLNNEEGYADNNLRFFRKSRYDAKQQIHYNKFRIEKLDNDQETVLERYTESHAQRIYTLDEMLGIIADSNFDIVAKYQEFDLVEANKESLRITMVLSCQQTQ